MLQLRSPITAVPQATRPESRSSERSDSPSCTRTTLCAPFGAAIDFHRALASEGLVSPSGAARLALTTAIETRLIVAGGTGDTADFGGSLQEAARLGQLAEAGQIVISDATRQLVGHAVEAEPLTRSAGDDGPGGWTVADLLPEAESFRRRFDFPLVGRERELAQLNQAFERAVHDRSTHLVTVLRRSWDRQESSRRGVSACHGHAGCGGHGSVPPLWGRITFLPVADMVTQLWGPEPMSGIAKTLADESDAGPIAERVAEILGVGEEGAVAEETLWALRKLFAAAARNRPLLLVFEDVHWAESTLLDLIEQLADRTRGVPLVVVCLARPELLAVRPGWGGGSRTQLRFSSSR